MRTNTAPLKTDCWSASRAFVAHRASRRCDHGQAFLALTGQVDHIVPRLEIDLLDIGVFDPTNLQYLCHPCHAAKSNRERWSGNAGPGTRAPMKP